MCYFGHTLTVLGFWLPPHGELVDQLLWSVSCGYPRMENWWTKANSVSHMTIGINRKDKTKKPALSRLDEVKQACACLG